ncbi:MAG: IS66-like element accessory protein TnpA [Pseudomonadales bacterium]
MAVHSIRSPVEVLSVTDTGRRRRWTDAEKLRIVDESYAAPRQAAATARRYDISRSLLTRWRREAREGLLMSDGDRTRFAPVSVSSGAASVAGADVQSPSAEKDRERAEIILPNGRRLVICPTTEVSILARLIQIVERA